MGQKYQKTLNNLEIINWAKKYLKKSNRIFWYLKLVKRGAIVHPSEALKHLYSMNIPEIESFPIERMPHYSMALMNLYAFEQSYLQKQAQKDQLIPVKPNEETVEILFPDGFAWVNLNTHHCRIEGAALGHCGNSTGHSGEQILSLRKKVIKGNKEFWKPHLTFILKPSGILGEMKGKQNTKPHEKYHSYIWSLLTHSLVKGIEGQGYAPEKNFHLMDLKKEKILEFLNNYSDKLSVFQKEVIKNRENLNFFLNLEVRESKEAEEILRWVENVEILKSLVLQGKKPVSQAAATLIKDKAEIKSLTLSVPHYAAQSLYLNKGLTNEEALEIFKAASPTRASGIGVFYVIKNWNLEELVTISQCILRDGIDKYLFLSIAMSRISELVTVENADLVYLKLTQDGLSNKEDLNKYVFPFFLEKILLSKNETLQKELYPLATNFQLIEKLLKSENFKYGKELILHFYESKLSMKDSNISKETNPLFKTIDISPYEGILKNPQTKAVLSEWQIDLLGKVLARLYPPWSINSSSFNLLVVKNQESAENPGNLRITLHKRRS